MSQYDKQGNLRIWMSDFSKREFDLRAKCFVYKFGSYEVDGHYINGLQNLDENLADHAALKVSYQAYRSHLEKSKQPEAKLPGLNFTGDQLFFLSYAQTFCSVERSESRFLKIVSSSHAPPSVRVNGQLSNFDEFLAAFHCPSTSAMYSIKKCSLWD